MSRIRSMRHPESPRFFQRAEGSSGSRNAGGTNANASTRGQVNAGTDGTFPNWFPKINRGTSRLSPIYHPRLTTVNRNSASVDSLSATKYSVYASLSRQVRAAEQKLDKCGGQMRGQTGRSPTTGAFSNPEFGTNAGTDKCGDRRDVPQPPVPFPTPSLDFVTKTSPARNLGKPHRDLQCRFPSTISDSVTKTHLSS
jgi:hypothetical protein